MTEHNNTWIWIDGQWQTHWPSLDRATQYGDGLYETCRLNQQGDMPLWSWHQQRLLHGLVALDFPIDSLQHIEHALAALPKHPYRGLKLLVSRGAGERGYGYQSDWPIHLQLQLFQPPAWGHERYPFGVDTGINDVRLAQQPLLAGIKHNNRLEQVMARARFAPHWQESILLDTQGNVTEGCMSNLYLLEGEQWVTPMLDQAGVNGVIRRWLSQHTPMREERIDLVRLHQADAVFMSNALNGFVMVRSVDQMRYDTSIGSVAQRMQQHWQTQLQELWQ